MRIGNITSSKYIKTLSKYIPKPIKGWLRYRFFTDPLLMSNRELHRLEQLPRLFHTTSTVLGKHIQLTDPYWYIFMYREIFEEQVYKFISHNPIPNIIDCGSNIGLSIIYFKYLYPDAHIIGLEPDPEIFSILRSNLQNYNFKDIELHQKAVWKIDTILPFVPDGSLGGKLDDQIVSGQAVKVQTIRLLDLLQVHVDFLKLDIEGAEYEVILDSANMLRNVDYLFVEYHGKAEGKQSLHEILKILQDAGFRYYLKDTNPISHPFIEPERSKNYDLQVNIFAYH